MTITLTEPCTNLVWRSSTSGAKSVSIPGSDTTNDGYTLDIITTLGVGDTYTVTPLSGTIGGDANFSFTDGPCTLSLVSDADNNDWVIKCLCCRTLGPLPNPSPTGWTILITGTGAPSLAQISSIKSPAIAATSVTLTRSTGGPLDLVGGISTNIPDNQSVVLFVAQFYSTVASRTITGVSGGGLTWYNRGRLQGTNPSNSHFCTTEYWWAPAPTTHGSFAIATTFSGAISGNNIGVVVVLKDVLNYLSPFDTEPTLPVAAQHFSASATLVTAGPFDTIVGPYSGVTWQDSGGQTSKAWNSWGDAILGQNVNDIVFFSLVGYET